MADYSHAAARLTQDLAATSGRLAQLRADFGAIVAASADSNADDEHDPEGSTIAFERSQVGALISQAELHLAEIRSAEQRIHDDTYGVCESCGAAIGAARLEARPVVRTCIACATEAEKRP